ncbi:MAG: hypothetical protein ACRDBQ_16820, partial [Shewanella sp.]
MKVALRLSGIPDFLSASFEITVAQTVFLKSTSVSPVLNCAPFPIALTAISIKNGTLSNSVNESLDISPVSSGICSQT